MSSRNKPTNFDRKNCEAKSSKCVIWDGEDMTDLGIDICRGDSVDEVVYKLATKYFELKSMFDIENYPIQCLTQVGNSETNIRDFKDLINVIISKICS